MRFAAQFDSPTARASLPGGNGCVGAKHYQPSLDLVGNPRLDLSIHSGRKTADLSFVERLDPGLERTARRDESPTLVIHTIRRAESLFQPGEDGLSWADPVECLLDLQEARLEYQIGRAHV